MSHGITEWEAEEMRREMGPTSIERRDALLREVLVSMKHARIFIASREKMHPTGVGLYDDLVDQIEKEFLL